MRGSTRCLIVLQAPPDLFSSSNSCFPLDFFFFVSRSHQSCANMMRYPATTTGTRNHPPTKQTSQTVLAIQQTVQPGKGLPAHSSPPECQERSCGGQQTKVWVQSLLRLELDSPAGLRAQKIRREITYLGPPRFHHHHPNNAAPSCGHCTPMVQASSSIWQR